jgi:hypothetical protein
MDRLEPPDLREQVLLHEESANRGLDPAGQLRRFLVELNRLELASQLVFIIKPTGPRKSGFKPIEL